MNRRDFTLSGLATVFVASLRAHPVFAATYRLEVFKSPTCGCCAAWVEHMAQAGFDAVALNVDLETLRIKKTNAGVTQELSSCHTAFIAGYFIEGHVRAKDVQRLLLERPDALGLTVPGMPIGSPGMEMDNRRDAYDTLLVLRDGTTRVFAKTI